MWLSLLNEASGNLRGAIGSCRRRGAEVTERCRCYMRWLSGGVVKHLRREAEILGATQGNTRTLKRQG
jgi:hypothetical protein